MPASAPLRLIAPAKVNFFLEVLGRRPDGYHDLRMLMAPVSLADDLWLEAVPEVGCVEVTSEGDEGVPSGEANLCYRAARFYFAATGVAGGARIRVRKRVPVGAGLGGGSSDAAAVLLGLEALYGTPLTAADRALAGFRVGADVPFFFARSAAWVEGIGEQVTPLAGGERLWLVLVHPGTFLATGAVFSRFTRGLTTPGRPHTIAQFNFPGVLGGLRNDLQPAAVELEGRIAAALAALAAVGAPGRLMTGSGSAVFGLFPDQAAARRAAAELRAGDDWRVEVVHTLPPGAFPFPGGGPDWGVDKR